MSSATLGTYNPADGKNKGVMVVLYRSLIITMDAQAAGMPAGTGQLMELKIINTVIIKILR